MVATVRLPTNISNSNRPDLLREHANRESGCVFPPISTLDLAGRYQKATIVACTAKDIQPVFRGPRARDVKSSMVICSCPATHVLALAIKEPRFDTCACYCFRTSKLQDHLKTPRANPGSREDADHARASPEWKMVRSVTGVPVCRQSSVPPAFVARMREKRGRNRAALEFIRGSPAHEQLAACLRISPRVTRAVAQAGRRGAQGRAVRSQTRRPDLSALRIEPLYARDAQAQPLLGRKPGSPWQVIQRLDHPDPAVASRQALQDLEGGATGLALVFLALPELTDSVLSLRHRRSARP